MTSRIGSERRPRRRRRNLIDDSAGRNPEHYNSLEDTPNQAVEDTVARVAGDLPSSGELTPDVRLEQVQGRAPEYLKEYRLTLLHRLLMRRIPLDQIADQLGVSVRTVQRDRTELFKKLREQAGALDVNEYIGDTISFYNESRAMSLRLATASTNPLPVRLAALSRAMQAQKDKTSVLQASGVFEVAKFKIDEVGGNKELQELIKITEDIFKEDSSELVEELDINLDDDETVNLL